MFSVQIIDRQVDQMHKQNILYQLNSIFILNTKNLFFFSIHPCCKCLYFHEYENHSYCSTFSEKVHVRLNENGLGIYFEIVHVHVYGIMRQRHKLPLDVKDLIWLLSCLCVALTVRDSRFLPLVTKENPWVSMATPVFCTCSSTYLE